MTTERSGAGAPFAAGSVSLRLYPHAMEPTALLAELERQAVLAVSCGFDGVMLSERHGGAWGQIPNPLQAASWLLSSMPGGWVAPCPILLPFRNPMIVAEELAWLQARFPGRVGAGFGTGGNRGDFEAVGVDFDERFKIFDQHLRELAAIWSDDDTVEDPAIARAKQTTLPLVSAATGPIAVLRAAELGLGLIGSSIVATEVTRRNADRYYEAGGRGPHVLICRVWLGEPPLDLMERQFSEYRHASSMRDDVLPAAAGLIASGDPVDIATRVIDRIRESRADALNLRVHVAGLDTESAREQIETLGSEVLPHVRSLWTHD